MISVETHVFAGIYNSCLVAALILPCSYSLDVDFAKDVVTKTSIKKDEGKKAALAEVKANFQKRFVHVSGFSRLTELKHEATT